MEGNLQLSNQKYIKVINDSEYQECKVNVSSIGRKEAKSNWFNAEAVSKHIIENIASQSISTDEETLSKLVEELQIINYEKQSKRFDKFRKKIIKAINQSNIQEINFPKYICPFSEMDDKISENNIKQNLKQINEKENSIDADLNSLDKENSKLISSELDHLSDKIQEYSHLEALTKLNNDTVSKCQKSQVNRKMILLERIKNVKNTLASIIDAETKIEVKEFIEKNEIRK